MRNRIGMLNDDDLASFQSIGANLTAAQSSNASENDYYNLEREALVEFLKFHTRMLDKYNIDRGDIEGIVYIDTITGNIFEIEDI